MKEIIKQILVEQELPGVKSFFGRFEINYSISLKNKARAWYIGNTEHFCVHPEQQRILDTFMVKDKEKLLSGDYWLFIDRSVLDEDLWWVSFETPKSASMRCFYKGWRPCFAYQQATTFSLYFSGDEGVVSKLLSDFYTSRDSKPIATKTKREFLDIYNLELEKVGFETRY